MNEDKKKIQESRAEAFDWLQQIAESASDTHAPIYAKILCKEIMRLNQVESAASLLVHYFARNNSKQMEKIYLNSLRPLLANTTAFQTIGTELVKEERQRQVKEEGFDFDHDRLHPQGTLIRAAHCYHCYAMAQLEGEAIEENKLLSLWPFGLEWWNPSNDPVRNMVKAAALIAAEIDRRI